MKRIPKSHNGELDLLKFIFSIIIVVHHSSSMFDGVQYFFRFGSLAVEFFFIVSGYLFAVSVMKKKEPYDVNTIGSETASFIFKKIYGLWFFFIFAAVLRFAADTLYLGAGKTFGSPEFPTLILNLFFGNMSGMPTYDPIAPSWYISAMLIAMAVLYPIFRKKKDLFISLIAPLVAFMLYGIMMHRDGHLTGPTYWYDFVYKGVVRAFAGICLGCLVYRVSQKMKTNPILTQSGDKVPHILSAVEIAAVVLSIIGMSKMTEKNFAQQPVIVLGFAIAVAICTSKMSSISKYFQFDIFSYLGKLSMTVFLCHSPVIGLMYTVFDKITVLSNIRNLAVGRWLLVFGLVVASIALGVVCLKVCEPWKKKVDNWVQKKKALAE